MLTGLGLSAVLFFGSLGDSIGSMAVFAAGEDEEILSGEPEEAEDALSEEEADAGSEDEEAVSADEPDDGGEAEADQEEVSGEEAADDEGEPEDEDDPAEEPESDGLFYIEDEDDPNRKDTEVWITTIHDEAFYYDGNAFQPHPHIYNGEDLLTEGKDYTLAWAHNVKAYEMENKAYPSEDDFEAAPRIIVTMKGSYTGSTLAFFNIHPAPLSDGRTVISETTYLYNGKKQSYTPSVTFKGVALKNNTDFDFGVLDEEGELRKLTDEELTGKAGENVYTMVTIRGKGNFDGYAFTGLNILDEKGVSASQLKVSAIPVQPYTGKAVTIDTLTKKGKPFELSVSYGKTKLVRGVDYTVSDPFNAVEPGKYSVVIRGKNTPGTDGLVFVGEKTVGFTISASLKQAVVTGLKPSYDVTPGVIYVRPDEDSITLTLGGAVVPKDCYSISYKNDRKAGTATMTFTGKNGFTGKKTAKYKINARNIAATNIYVSAGPYLKKGGKPILTIDDDGEALTEGVHYTLSYKNNKAVSAAASKKPVVIIKGKGLYGQKTEKEFEINSCKFSEAYGVKVTAADKKYSPKAGAYTTKVRVTDIEGSVLKAGVDYEKEIVYKRAGIVLTKNDTVNVGDVITVEVSGKGNFSNDSISTTYRILDNGYDISKASVSVKDQEYYSYEPVTVPPLDENFSVKLGGKKLSLVPNPYLAPGVDGFAVDPESYQNNTKCGTASFTIYGVGRYGGTKVVKFTIKPVKIKGISPVKFIPKPEKCIEVTDFGAIPDDGTDDTGAINAAISAAAKDDENGHNLYFPAGRYNVGASGSINITDSGVNLILDGEAELYVGAKGSDGYNVILIRADNVNIRGGVLAGERFRHAGGGSVGQYGMGISIDKGKNITIRDMVIKDNRGDGIYINDGGHGTVSNVTIKGCDIYDNARNNVGVIRCDYLTIEKCHMYYEHDGHSPMACIDLEPDAGGSVPENKKINHVVIRNCKLETYQHCSAHQQGSGEWAYFGIMIIYGFGTPVVRDVLIENCEIYGDLSLGSSSNVRWPGTTVHGNIIEGDT